MKLIALHLKFVKELENFQLLKSLAMFISLWFTECRRGSIYAVSHLELDVAKYETAYTLPIWLDHTTLIMSEKISNKLKILQMGDCYAPSDDLLLRNNLKFIELANMNPEHLPPNLSNLYSFIFIFIF